MIKAGSLQGKSVNKLGEKDIRFTRNKANTVVYVLGWPSAPGMRQSPPATLRLTSFQRNLET